MTWSYSGDPSNSVLDEVRYLIGDTDTEDQQITDEEINYHLTKRSNEPYGAASDACRAIAAKYAREMDKRVGQLWIDASERYAHYKDLAETIWDQKKRITGLGTVFLGNANQERRIFELGMNDHNLNQFETSADD